jgi:hypothetical protein
MSDGKGSQERFRSEWLIINSSLEKQGMDLSESEEASRTGFYKLVLDIRI